MGGPRLSDNDWAAYRGTTQTKSQSQVFSRSRMKTTNDPRTSFDPKTITVREARDSVDCPQSTPIIIAFDVTGSMGEIPYEFVKEGLGTLMKEIYDRRPVPDPQIMCMAVGDVRSDDAPLQVTQFETDIRIAKQIEDFYLEGNGGGNHGESYNLPWYFAANRTSTDNYEKRGKKGLLFTIGDEPPVYDLTKKQIQTFIGGEVDRDYTSKELLDMVRRQYDVYHIVVVEGYGLRQYGEQAVIGEWNQLLGEGHVIRLSNYKKLAEVVTSVIQRNAGVDFDTIISSWSGETALVVASALPAVPVRRGTGNNPGVFQIMKGPKVA